MIKNYWNQILGVTPSTQIGGSPFQCSSELNLLNAASNSAEFFGDCESPSSVSISVAATGEQNVSTYQQYNVNSKNEAVNSAYHRALTIRRRMMLKKAATADSGNEIYPFIDETTTNDGVYGSSTVSEKDIPNSAGTLKPLEKLSVPTYKEPFDPFILNDDSGRFAIPSSAPGPSFKGSKCRDRIQKIESIAPNCRERKKPIGNIVTNELLLNYKAKKKTMEKKDVDVEQMSQSHLTIRENRPTNLLVTQFHCSGEHQI